MTATLVPPPVPEAGMRLAVTSGPEGRAGRFVVRVVGEVDAATTPLLQLCLDARAAQRDLQELIVDVEGATFRGADGMVALERARRRCLRRGIRVAVRGVGHPRMLRRPPAGAVGAGI